MMIQTSNGLPKQNIFTATIKHSVIQELSVILLSNMILCQSAELTRTNTSSRVIMLVTSLGLYSMKQNRSN